MSQKSTRRARRQTNDDETAPSIKMSLKKTNGTNKIEQKNDLEPENAKINISILPPPEISVEAATDTEKPEPEPKIAEPEPKIMQTRARSKTPQSPPKTDENSINGADLTIGNEEIISQQVASNESLIILEEVEMDPLVLVEEGPESELNFGEEAESSESGKGSPILNRCKTRRSSSRNVPTPKTPKNEPETDNDSNLSTQVEVGSDATRLNFSEETENSFLNLTKSKSFGETLRTLSTRRPIRAVSADYRKLALKHNTDRADFGSGNYPVRHSVDRVSLGGVKRRNGSDSDEEASKRFKGEGQGFFARLSSPLSSIRSRMRFSGGNAEDLRSSPKLTAYKELDHDGKGASKVCEINEERRWCSIM